MINAIAFIEQLATRFPDATKEIVEICAKERASFIDTGKKDPEQNAIITEMGRRLSHQIATDVDPDRTSNKHRVMLTRVEQGIAAHAYPVDIRQHRILTERRQAAE